MLVCQKTDIGLVRKSNQDALIVKDGIYGVADGMGGCNGGETASMLASETISEFLSSKEADLSVLKEAVTLANRRIYETAGKDPSLSGMGTTLSMIWECSHQVLIAHVGDSRVYHYRNGKLNRSTQDHSLVAEMVRNKLISEEMARVHPYRNVITKALGVDPTVDADIFAEEKLENDIWLICSDGLHGLVPDQQMEAVLGSNAPLDEMGEKLLKAALDAGGTDNVSLVLCKAEGKEEGR